jgi:hypothetical protein
MSSWIDLLKSLLETCPSLELRNDLLPVKKVDDSFMEEWREAIKPFGVDDAEVAMIMGAIRQQLLERKTIELPLNMTLGAEESACGRLFITVRPTSCPRIGF